MLIVPTSRTQNGFLLVEAMVALIILSIGIIGLSASQLTASKNNVSAMLRSEAAIYSGEIIDRMRSNISGAACEEYDITEQITPPENPDNQAEEDLDDWLGNLSASFGGVNVLASIDCAQDLDCLDTQIPVCEVKIQWDDARAEGTVSESIIEHVTHVHL